MMDLKKQSAVFAVLGKLEVLIKSWLKEGDKSIGAPVALARRLKSLIEYIDNHLEAGQ